MSSMLPVVGVASLWMLPATDGMALLYMYSVLDGRDDNSSRERTRFFFFFLF